MDKRRDEAMTDATDATDATVTKETTETTRTTRRAIGGRPSLPPRWVIRAFWIGHRAIHRLTGRRRGLRPPTADGRFGMMLLRTVGRRSGREREAILGYHAEGTDLVTLAMNGWGDGDPAWWLNLRAHPEATVELKDGPRQVRAREAVGDERARLWARLHDDPAYGGDLDAYAGLRSTATAVVILEPRTAAG
jgi:deazaflavin-dependent oxidoreductase (nitroreductase family)